MATLYPFQQEAVNSLLSGKHLCDAKVGTGKGSIALFWAHEQNKPRVLVITTASKRDVKNQDGLNDFEAEADMWFPGWRTSLSSFEVISWAGLVKWFEENNSKLDDYAIIADEVASMKAGVGSQRGRAFLKIANRTSCWTGYSATLGDAWIDYQAYFVATGKIRNKTSFMSRFCNIQTYKGFPEIVNYRNTDLLKQWLNDITVKVDSSVADKQLPPENHKMVYFKQPTKYKEVLKTRIHPETGDFIDTTMGLCATLRQMCLTKEKLTWVKDFVENLGERAVFFYNFIEEGDKLEETIKSALPKGAKLWRIDGKTHNVPTEKTVGKYDVVLAQWQAGSMGLNLQFMQQWVSVSPHYSWSISEQGRGRIKRIGQKGEHMDFYYLCCRNSIEEDVYKILKTKGDFVEKLWLDEKENS